ncbi:MAG TPA: MarR family transcriptional regulator [Chloroflexota bacterium]|nr:MarR family transcriptional regulator [Chloroflexota bacterium]
MIEAESTIDDSRITTFGRLFEANAKLSHLLARDLVREFDLPLSWYGVLLHVGRSPGGIRPIGELISATAFTTGGVTRLVDRMERAGLVERRPCPSDRRVMYVGLTESGRALLEKASAVHAQSIQRYLIDRLEPREVPELERLLQKLV